MAYQRSTSYSRHKLFNTIINCSNIASIVTSLLASLVLLNEGKVKSIKTATNIPSEVFKVLYSVSNRNKSILKYFYCQKTRNIERKKGKAF